MNADRHNLFKDGLGGLVLILTVVLCNFVRFDNVQPSEGVVRFSWGTMLPDSIEVLQLMQFSFIIILTEELNLHR